MAVTTTARKPKISAQPPMTIDATSTVKPIETSSGRNEGGGMWTPAGGVPDGAGRAPAAT